MYAFFMEAASIEYHVERYCDLKQLGGLLDSKGYGIALPKDSPYTAAISAGVLSLQEDGVLKAEWAHSESEISLAPALFCPESGYFLLCLYGIRVLASARWCRHWTSSRTSRGPVW